MGYRVALKTTDQRQGGIFMRLAKINFFNPKGFKEVLKTGVCLRTPLVGSAD